MTAVNASNITGTLSSQEAHAAMQNISVMMILVCSFFIMSMQLGFAMFEVGSVREAHRMTVLSKNILDSGASCLAFWAFSEWDRNNLCGGISCNNDGLLEYHLLFFNWAFCATAVTICSGSMAERTHMVAYLTYAAAMGGVIYPVIAQAAWGSEGSFLYSQFHGKFSDNSRYHDFAGSGVVHVTGGVSALVGNSFLGRRILQPVVPFGRRDSSVVPPEVRFPTDGQPEDISTSEELIRLSRKPAGGWQRRFDDVERDKIEFKSRGYLQVMGMFTLWVGWYGFNTGSTFSVMLPGSVLAAVVAWNTTLAGAGGCIGAYLFYVGFQRQLSVETLCNGALSGLVAITGACDVATPSFSLGIGITAGLVILPLSSSAVTAMRVDDPVSAIPVHAASGLFGVLVVGLCKPHCKNLELRNVITEGSTWKRFCSSDHTMSSQLLSQAWGAWTILWWTLATSTILWMIFAISERVRAFETEDLLQLERLLGDMSEPDFPEQRVKECRYTIDRSPIARRVLRQLGCCQRILLLQASAAELTHARKALGDARMKCADTALELRHFHPVTCIARMARTCRLFREIAFVRLRIAPFAELSGLGAATADGGRLLSVLRGTMMLVEQARQEAEHDAQAVHLPLQRQVSELSRTVHRQEQLLHSLTNHPGGIRASSRRTGLPQLQNTRPPHAAAATAEREGTMDSFGSGSLNSREGPVESVSSGRTPQIGPGARLSSSSSYSSDQAVSFHSFGNSASSRWSSNLPPAVIGRSSRTMPISSPTELNGMAGGGVNNSQLTALVAAVQLHQLQLVTALQQRLAQSPSSGVLEAGED